MNIETIMNQFIDSITIRRNTYSYVYNRACDFMRNNYKHEFNNVASRNLFASRIALCVSRQLFDVNVSRTLNVNDIHELNLNQSFCDFNDHELCDIINYAIHNTLNYLYDVDITTFDNDQLSIVLNACACIIHEC